MKVYKGFADLLASIDRLPNVGWLFVDSTIEITSKGSVSSAAFYVAEDNAEEILFEKSKRAFVECSTMLDIKAIADKRVVKPDLEAYLEVALYYLENDDFKD